MKIVAVMLYSGSKSNSYERNMIRRCLRSMQGFVDGVVMVHTGRSKKFIQKIAKKFDVILHHSRWTGDFSKHRNEALNFAYEHFPEEDLWWFIIDPDEALIKPQIGFDEMRRRIKTIPQEATALAILVHEIDRAGNKTSSWRGMRFFRKSANLKYKNIVHNKPVIDGHAAMTNIEINHYGYSHRRTKLKEKWVRTNWALKQQISEDPYDHRTLYYLAQNSASLQRYEEAIFWGIRCLQYFPYPDEPAKLNFYGSIYYLIGMVYARLGNAEESWRWLQHGLKLFPEDLDLNFAMALIGARALRRDLFEPSAKKYLQLLEDLKKPEPATKFAALVPQEDYLERNIHHIAKDSEEEIRYCLEHWDELEEMAA